MASGTVPVIGAIAGIFGASSDSVQSPCRANRRPEFDFMRVFVVAGLVVFHSAVVFASGASWFVKDARPSLAFTIFLVWGSLWGMPLLFVISGMSARYALQSRSAAAFARERLARLLVPFLVGLVLLVPLMFYLARLGQPSFHESYGRFWLGFLNLPQLALGLVTHGSWRSAGAEYDPAHMWFLYCLLVFSLALLPLFQYLRRPRGARLVDLTAAFTERHGLIVLLSAAIPLALVEMTFGPDVNTGGWERVAYGFLLLYGYLIASDRRFESAMKRARRPALAFALLATGALIGWAEVLGTSAVDPISISAVGWCALQGLAGWAWVVTILGFAWSLSNRRESEMGIAVGTASAAPEPRWRPFAQYANEAVLPFYVLHEPVIVGLAWFVVRWNVPVFGKYVALVILAFATTLALYELLVRRLPGARFLLGMKPASQHAARNLLRVDLLGSVVSTRRPNAAQQGEEHGSA